MKKEGQSSVNTEEKQKPQLFKKGESGNSKGRPKGSRNRATIIAEQLIDADAEDLVRVCLDKAKEGDSTCMKLVMDRLVSVRKDRPITVDLPAIKNAEDIVRATGKITEAVGMGTLTPSEGELLSKILDNHRRAVETIEIEKRIVELERRTETK